MTPRQARTTLRDPFLAAGFHAVGSRFVHETPEVVHSVDVSAVRRLDGCIQIHHEIALKRNGKVVLTQEIVSHGFRSSFPRIWSDGSVDPRLVMEQVAVICRSFGNERDIAHFYSDRSHPDSEGGAAPPPHAGPARTLCASQAQQAVQRIGRELLAPEFSRVPQHENFEIWCSKREVEGYRHCAYVQANHTCTLAHVEMFALPTAVVQTCFRNDDALRALMTAPKSALFASDRPVLIPMLPDPAPDYGPMREALLSHMDENPPHLLQR